MMNRRDLVKLSAAVVSIMTARLPLTEKLNMHPQHPVPPITGVLFDKRYSDARLFAKVLAQQGALAIETEQDAVRVWYKFMRQRAPSAMDRPRIAGLTTYSDLVIIRSCAGSERLRVVFEAIHDCRRSAVMTHAMQCGNDADSIRDVLRSSGEHWSSALAQSLLVSRLSGTPRPHAHFISGPKSADHPGTLVSWMVG